MDRHDFLIVLVMLTLIFLVSVLKERNVALREQVAAQNIAVRFAVYYALILSVVIFGA